MSFWLGVAVGTYGMGMLVCVAMWLAVRAGGKDDGGDSWRDAQPKEPDSGEKVVAPHPGACPENTRAGAQPAATTAFARPLGASPLAWPNGRNFIVYRDGWVAGTLHAQTTHEAELMACAIHGPTATVKVYSRASLAHMVLADYEDDRAERASKAQHA